MTVDRSDCLHNSLLRVDVWCSIRHCAVSSVKLELYMYQDPRCLLTSNLHTGGVMFARHGVFRATDCFAAKETICQLIIVKYLQVAVQFVHRLAD